VGQIVRLNRVAINLIFSKLIIFWILLVLTISKVTAQNYSCELRPNGYAAAYTSLNPSLSRKVQKDFLMSISPRTFQVNANYVKVDNTQPIEVSAVIEKKAFKLGLTQAYIG